jgi:type 1 fimbria pilin
MSKTLFSALAAVVIVLSLSVMAAAQDQKSVTLTGNILDVACSAKATSAEAAAGHKKGCALSGNCLKSGLGVYADGKFVAFDEAGTAKAKEALEKTSKPNGAKFKVMGKMADGKLMVDSITEVE